MSRDYDVVRFSDLEPAEQAEVVEMLLERLEMRVVEVYPRSGGRQLMLHDKPERG